MDTYNHPDWDISIHIDWSDDVPWEQRSQTEGLLRDIIDLEWGYDADPDEVIHHLNRLCDELDIPATFRKENII